MFRTLIGVLLFSVMVAEGRHVRLFVLTGQSNSLGTTGGGEAVPGPGSDPADGKVIFWWDNVVDASTSLGTSGGEWQVLQEQQGGFYPENATHWGPEMNFARTLTRVGVKDFGIIKASRGGGGNGNWSKAGGGHMYDHVVATVEAATTALTAAGDTFEIVGMLYVQGESDSSSEAAISDTRLSELFANLRTDLSGASEMHLVVGGIAAAGANRDTVREKQAALAGENATIDYFENVDLRGQLYDGLHFNKAAKLGVGKRFAREFLEAGVVKANYGKLAFVGDSITQGGLGFSSYRYEVFKHLVDAGAEFEMVGSVTGFFQGNGGGTPNYGGEIFRNIHEGHFGWRAFWLNGRVPLPAGRRSQNRGEGTVLTWTDQATEYEVNSAGNAVAYPDPGASGSGNTGVTYVPDTVVLMVGINDLADGGTAEQLRDDVALAIDQFRAANAGVAIFINYLLHTDQAASLQVEVDLFNALLQPLADLKNGQSSISPVWVIDASTGFDAVAMTHDAVHPNSEGERFVGFRMAEGLGLSPEVVEVSDPIFPTVEREDLEICFQGNEIFDGSGYVNGWSEVTPGATGDSLVGIVLKRDHLNGAGEWLEGEMSSLDGGATKWSSGNEGDWTFEIEMKFLENPAGFAIWLGTGTARVIVDVFGDRTENSGGGKFEVRHDNLDGEFHRWRVVHDSGVAKYHVWRDGVRLTPVEGVNYDSTGNDERMVLGDRTGGGFGDNYEVEIASVCYDQSGGYLPKGADLDGDGLSDEYEVRYFGSLSGGEPGADLDGDGSVNLEEFTADTDPLDGSSFLLVKMVDPKEGRLKILVAGSSLSRLYRLYHSNDLGISDDWKVVEGPVLGTGGELVIDGIELMTERGFFRIGVTLE